MVRHRNTLLAAMLATSLPAVAIETTVGVTVESIYSDNITRVSDNKVSDVTHQPGVFVALDHEGSKIRANARYDYERRIRQEGSFDNDDSLSGTSTIVWQAIPGRLDFTASNTRTETTVDGQQTDLPTNLQVTDSTRVGPTLRFRVRRNDEIQLQYFYTQTRADVTENTDSKRQSASLSYLMNVGQNDQLVFNVANNKVEFDGVGVPDLDAVTGSVQWQRSGPSLDFSLLAGYTTMDRTLGRDDIESEVFDARLTWRMTPQTAVSLTAVRELRDRASILELGILPFGTNSQIDSDLNEVFLNDRAEILFSTVLYNNEFMLALGYDKQDFVDLLEDLERTTATLGWQRRLNPRLTAGIQLSYVQEKQLDLLLQEEDRLGGEVSLEYTHSRRLSLMLTGSHNSVDTPISIQEYSENLFSLRVDYLLLE